MTRATTVGVSATLPASAAGVSGPERDAAQVVPGARLGRYIVLAKLGAGAMGVVFSAHDPELDRRVAIKLLKPGEWDDAGSRSRLQREAQALARLAHPNVVAVYDVGVHDGDLFLAMEFVAGKTVGDWLRDRDGPPHWREAVRVFQHAGRGLAAAHGAALVHRDFKPDNVMIDDDGKVRVMDFGLARASATTDAAAAQSGGDGPTAPSPALVSELTQTGTMLGTPAYMSPEQFNRQPADARSDQFSFCVALYEALYGHRPFRSESLASLVLAVNQAEIREPPRGSSVPAWLRRVVVRGLCADPAERHASMEALLEALAADPGAKRRRRLTVGTLAVGGVASVTALVAVVRQPSPQVCTGMDSRLAGVWDGERKATIEAAMTRTSLPYAASTWARVEATLDEYTAKWVSDRRDACLATHRGEQSSELLDLRMACFDHRLRYLSTTTDVLASADTTVVDNAILAVTAIPTLQRCADVEALTSERPLPEDPRTAQRVTELDGRLARASALRDAARYTTGLELADAVVAEAADIGYAPLLARAWLLDGEIHVHLGDYDSAEESLTKAYDFAVAERMYEEAASASALLMHMFGYYQDLHEQGRTWAVQADPLSRAVGTDEARALFLNNRGALTMAEGRPEVARADHERALELRQASFGPYHPDVAASLTHLGNVARDLGEGTKALGYYQRALEIRERVFGGDHPMVGASLYNLGSAARTTGQLQQARAWLEQALRIRRRALGDGHPYVASTLYQLGSVARLAGDHAQSQEHHEAALRIWDETLGGDHPDVAWAHSDLGRGALARKQLDLAKDHLETALRIRKTSLGADHPLVSASLNALGEVAREGGAFEEARGHHERALEVATRAESTARRAASLLGLGLVSLEQGDPAAAIVSLERALSIGQSAPQLPARVDEIRLALARARTLRDARLREQPSNDAVAD